MTIPFRVKKLTDTAKTPKQQDQELRNTIHKFKIFLAKFLYIVPFFIIASCLYGIFMYLYGATLEVKSLGMIDNYIEDTGRGGYGSTGK